MESGRLPKKSIALILSLAVLALFAAGIGAGYGISSVRLNHIEGRLYQQDSQILQLEKELLERQLRLLKLKLMMHNM